MTCEQMTELLPEYFRLQLNQPQQSTVELHLQDCSDCAEQVRLWKQLGELGDEQPGPMLKRRFDALLAAYQEGRWEHDHLASQRLVGGRSFWGWFRAPLPQLAMAGLLLVVGFGLGKYFDQPSTTRGDLAALHREVSSMRQLLVLSMLQQQSASERLQGVNWSQQLQQPDPEIISALIRSLKSDSSVDVRLAALDSLRRYSRESTVRQGVAEALNPKQSPLVQIAVIDALVEMRDRSAVARLQTFQQSPNITPVVRERARRGIDSLSRG
jgi:hypothetical protein